MTKDITLDLSLASIDAAIEEIHRMADGIDAALSDAAEELTELGPAAAEIHLNLAGESLGGYPVDIQAAYDKGARTGYVYSNEDSAAYLEYGTGIVGAHAPHPGIVSGESTPPVLAYMDRTYTKYDTYEHGLNGWNYRDPMTRELKHTAGMVGLAFMYNAYKDLEQMAPAAMRDAMKKRGVMK